MRWRWAQGVGAMFVVWCICAPAAARGPCHSVRVSGCGRKARVCVSTGDSKEAARKALEAFQRTYKCQAAVVNSYSLSCTESPQDRCDIRL